VFLLQYEVKLSHASGAATSLALGKNDPLEIIWMIILHFTSGLINLWLFLFSIFLFAAQPKEFFLDGFKKLEQRSHKCVELRGEYVE
jgi:hypothetical protein